MEIIVRALAEGSRSCQRLEDPLLVVERGVFRVHLWVRYQTKQKLRSIDTTAADDLN